VIRVAGCLAQINTLIAYFLIFISLQVFSYQLLPTFNFTAYFRFVAGNKDKKTDKDRAEGVQ